jgi:hypothetical protein
MVFINGLMKFLYLLPNGKLSFRNHQRMNIPSVYSFLNLYNFFFCYFNRLSSPSELQHRSTSQLKKQKRITFPRNQVFNDAVVDSFFTSSSTSLSRQGTQEKKRNRNNFILFLIKCHLFYSFRCTKATCIIIKTLCFFI